MLTGVGSLLLISLVDVKELRFTDVGLLWIILFLTAEGIWDVCLFGLCGFFLFVSGVSPMSGMI